MRVLVYGAGGVGLGLGSFLLAAGTEVSFVGRSNTVRALREHGLSRSGLFGPATAPGEAIHAARSLGDLPTSEPFDFVLVTVKTPENASTAQTLAAGLEAEPPVILCQNGWGNTETFAQHFPETQVWNARVITGFVRPRPAHVEVTAHAEPVAIGSLCGADTARIEPLCEALRRGGLPTETTSRIAEILWAKLLYNGCLNPLGAILEVPYGELAESAHTREIIAAVATETFAVMHAAGYAARWPDPAAYLASLYDELLPPTAAHESSTLQDLRAGRRTEIDALNGAVVRLGEPLGIATPVNRTLCALIRALEARRA
jgi:2-dehydropantoate 2-reductase